jgi:hypothetical protein
MTTATTVRFGERDLELGGKYLGEMREANPLLDDPAALRARLAEDGYLLVRGLHDPRHVLAARREIFAAFAKQEAFDPAQPELDGVINPSGKRSAFAGGADVTKGPEFRALVEGRRAMAFFDRLFGEPSLTFDYKWMRFVGNGEFTGAHYDNVYMSRGSARLHTVWTPIGDVPIAHGPLAVLVGSHNLPSYARVRETYGAMDVDRDRVGGWFSNDPVELVDRFGGRWATTEFRAGDALVFGMYSMHASLTNVSNRYRLTSDTRYQPASEPVDERWIGEKPKAHYGWHAGPQVPMEEKRKEWGV